VLNVTNLNSTGEIVIRVQPVYENYVLGLIDRPGKLCSECNFGNSTIKLVTYSRQESNRRKMYSSHFDFFILLISFSSFLFWFWYDEVDDIKEKEP
jgi:hypothetical protein